MPLGEDELRKLTELFLRLDSNRTGAITSREIQRLLSRLLDAPIPINTAKQMIWEVDYRGEGRITQSDMVGVLLRVRQDQEGYEPDGLANLIEFCMYEREDTGSISVEDAMAILSRRYASSVVVSPEAIRRFCVEAHATLHKKIGLAELIRQAEYRKVMLSSNSMQA